MDYAFYTTIPDFGGLNTGIVVFWAGMKGGLT
jgi:hypothetical protein